jgi:FkbM family methyltransferase
MKRFARKIRDNALVLSATVVALRCVRALGLMRSRRIYSHVPYRGVVSVDCGGGRHFRIGSRGHNIENGLYWDGLFAHEPTSMRFWISRAPNARVVLDIGANSGVFALASAAVGAHAVHAFEPLPRMHAILAENLAMNPGVAIHAWPRAVGAEDGVARIFDPGGDAPTSASLSQEFATGHFGNLPASEVPICTIDRFCAEQGIDGIDLIKIDVEGYEAQALRGMRNVVASCTPDILMEVLPGQEPILRQVVEELWPGKYNWALLDEGAGHVSRNVVLTSRTPRADAFPPVSGN